jgi:preprotein translocase subunit SecG
MYTAVIVLIIIIAVFLILAVLVQNSKGGGLASQYGGASSSQLMGVKKTGDLLEQITWGLAISLMVLTLSTTLLVSQPNEEGVNKVNIENAPQRQELPAPAPANQPAAPQPTTDTVKPK